VLRETLFAAACLATEWFAQTEWSAAAAGFDNVRKQARGDDVLQVDTSYCS
jgi:hypothetical protein